MTNYENDIMEKLQGDTPKQKYEYLLSISYSGQTAKQCAEIAKHYAIEFAVWITYNEWELITEETVDYYRNIYTSERITPEKLYLLFEKSTELPEHGAHECASCNCQCSCNKQPCSCCTDITEKPNEQERIESNEAFDKKQKLLNISKAEMRQIAFNFLEGEKYTHGFPDDWDGCVEIVAEFGTYIKNLLKTAING